MGLRAFHQLQARLERFARRLCPRNNRRRSPRRHEPRHLPASRRAGYPMKSAKLFSFFFFVLLSAALSPLALSQVPSGRDVVKPEAYSSLDPAAPGSSFQIAVVIKICPGFHVNARDNSHYYLIPTHLKSAPPAAVRAARRH